MGASNSSLLSCPSSDGTTYSAGAYSYKIACFNDSMYSDINTGALTEDSLDSCITLCSTASTCVGVSWLPTTKACWLKNALNSGSHNGLVWGARRIETSAPITSSTSVTTFTPTATPTPTPSSASGSQIVLPTTAPSGCSTLSHYGNMPGFDFSDSPSPWYFTGPDTPASYAVNNDSSSPFLTPNFFTFNSTGVNRNTVTQSLCNVYNTAAYEIYVKYAFQVSDAAASASSTAIYDLQILLNGTVAHHTYFTPSQLNPNSFSTTTYNFQAQSSNYVLAISWGLAAGQEATAGNVYSVMDISEIAVQEQEDFE